MNRRLTALVLLPLVFLIKGFVLAQFWVWFVVPLGAEPISIAHAAGLGLLAELVNGSKAESIDSAEELLGKFIVSVVPTALVFIVGWIVSLFM